MEILVGESVFLCVWCGNGVPTPLFLEIHPWSLTRCKLHVFRCDVKKYCPIIFNALWCNKHLTAQSASIVIAFEFFDMFVSRVAQAFFGGRENCACFRNNIPFFRHSNYFLWSNDFDNKSTAFKKNSLRLIVCHCWVGMFKNNHLAILYRQSWCAGA